MHPTGSRRLPPGGGAERNPEIDFHGQRRANETHVSSTDEEAMLARKGSGREAKLCFAGHLLMENRRGLAVDVMMTQATGRAEREAALKMLSRVRQRGRARTGRLTVGADKGFDTADFVEGCRDLEVTPHVAQNITRTRGSKVDDRTVTHLGYYTSQRIRKRIEEIFGWLKAIAGGRKLRYIGVERDQLWAEMATSAFNLIRSETSWPRPPECCPIRCSAYRTRPSNAPPASPRCPI